jgi:transcriptional regulator with XRE-family HTH domain
MDVRGLGEYIRKQREGSRLSLRNLSNVAGVSWPYLSQVERGLRRPSAEILQGIAKGLRISAETLYIQAGILEDRPLPDVAAAIMGDPTITERQKRALVQTYEAFRDEAGRGGSDASEAPPSRPPPARAPKRARSRTPKTPKEG